MYSYEIDSDLDISGMDMDMDMDECYYYFDGYDDEDCSDDEISRGNSFNYEDTAGEDRSNLNRYIIPTVVKSQQRRLRAHKRHSRDEPTLEGEDNEYFMQHIVLIQSLLKAHHIGHTSMVRLRLHHTLLHP